MEYLIDSNSLIDAHEKWYRPQVFGSVWVCLATHSNVRMTSFVYNEIKYPDELALWTKNTFQKQTIVPTLEITRAYNDVMNWITQSKRWNAAGISEWQSPDKADPWLIATAKVNSQTIVTLDGNGRATMPNIGSNSKKEPKINAVATQFNVPTMTIYELLEKLDLSI
ncbi:MULTISPECIES: DUF4411 family protein [Lactiplantibacillus]|uniref:DUF4411 family protein n=1 Tax=Lactiplantibacillus pentosus TaxID=1589 RepID=A0AAW8WB20_LACPE|nr:MULTISPECIES: DUF4411 family protein [Lactiplantibacillus]MBU7461973.1 DUF4411 family protein [Lactiplantibacillus pentosus]MBU7476511.1 DUF4411 family protein [Lactiplantibacillus pentosus]MBU7483289.1 DUF4411 family protein [Lactiplantibacillus sp. 30.2.29]MBU7486589.1 DUF4411 family protein [Lactiplantibacillus pentosus]MBU7499615.1 DUF4411 family protein [Lactiplantibacillus pentosus]